ncbi:TonB-dependent receptor [Marinoscillum pacificum]|uniref:TonB-dependent receptor n=1 Tax=Marinoscillum pacificum TaxID=392723 RepID=UPI0021577A78|nr:TonB-dependent receptor [Marinoscillum pacificum]
MTIRYLIPLLVLFSFTSSIAQTDTAFIYGKVLTNDKEAVPGAYVFLENTAIKSITNDLGEFQLEASPGEYNLVCQTIGYETKIQSVHLKSEQKIEISFSVNEKEEVLNDIVISGNAIKQVQESPYNVVALDAKDLHNSTMDLGGMLNRASGVKIRSSGGVGSNLSISLNGFTGSRVKVFMNGVPMEGFGSAFQLNNIPVSVANRIEVYKGVVPIEFGSDAIGGAINIVTNQESNTFLDLSYSFGSFNTHKPSVSAGYTSKNGFSVQLNAFLNYSDNCYKVHLDKMLDIETGSYKRGDYTVKRFHDSYFNRTIMTQVGFVEKPWADRFFIGLTAGELDADIQNASTMEIVYGQRTRSAKTILPSIEYYKRDLFIDNLTFRLTGNLNFNVNHNIDTAARLYNWYGDYLPIKTRGESGTNTLSEYTNQNFSSTANTSYRINKHHSISLNDVITGYSRKVSSDVPVEDLTAADTMRRAAIKNVLGLSYVYRYNENWNVNIFGKHYHQYIVGPMDTASTGDPKYEEQARSFQTTGYGIALTHFLNKEIQLKASLERAYRLPSGRQLFGDELLTSANTDLKPENSTNVNIGGSINQVFSRFHTIYIDLGAYYRFNKDFIRQVQNARYGTISNVNFGQVRNIGVDLEARYYYKNTLTLGSTLTYMDMRNREKLRSANSSVVDATYNNRMPNIPYFYGSTDATYYKHNLFGIGNVLSINYTFNFVGEFYLLWESQGTPNTKATLPRQLYHDLIINYSLKNGKYNISLEALNFTNAQLYDNWSMQKPGRSFNVKVRYYWNKTLNNN